MSDEVDSWVKDGKPVGLSRQDLEPLAQAIITAARKAKDGHGLILFARGRPEELENVALGAVSAYLHTRASVIFE